MRRRSVQKQAINVSLFPFLAVLICTMGALIVLLVMVVQQARVQVSAVVAQRAQPTADETRRQNERDDHLSRWHVLAQQRTLSTQELADRRLELSHLENHIREIERRWQQLLEDKNELDRLAQPREEDRRAAEQRLAELRAELAAETAKLEAARQSQARETRSFALIPYDGPNGTKRYPLYVECRSNGVFLQPEGIALSPADFLGPLGPGNPLDAALRAKREYLIRLGLVTPDQEPYPLLVVRPDGIEAYAMARAAMRAWDDEFGYELIEEETRLEFADPDPALAAQLAQVIGLARKRQSVLAAAMPSRFESSEPVSFVASSDGGFVPARRLDGTAAGRRLRNGGGARERAAGAGDSDLAGESARGSLRDGGETTGRNGDGATATGQPAGPSGDPRDRSTANGSAGGSQTGRSGGVAGGNAPIGTTLGGPGGSKRRGRNFGLPDYDEAKTEITRPIRVVCSADRLVLMPERGVEPFPRTILLTEDPQQNLDQVISNIWSRMDRWGIAVPGGYWKPVLEVQVTADAEARYQQLRSLLEDSGLVIERKSR